MSMLQIGPVAFSTTSPFDKLKSHAKGEWASQKRFARRNALQWTGYGDEDVTVSGTIYTDYFGGFGNLALLRKLMPRPQMVVSGAGDVFGLWCILDVSNEQSYQDAQGRPGKVSFDVKLGRYGEDAVSLGGGLFGIASSIMAGLPGAAIGLSLGGITAGVTGGLGLGPLSLSGGISASLGADGLSVGVDVGASLGPASVRTLF